MVKINGLTLPKVLDDILFKEEEAIYCAQTDYPESERNTLNADTETIKRYLGKYYPRSFTEGYFTTKDILSNDSVLEILNKKDDIHLLDIGAGPGPYSMGMIFALQQKLGKSKQFHVMAIDGHQVFNHKNNLIVKQISEKMKIKIKLKTKHKEFSHSSFPQDICSLLDSQRFDFIVTSKFINELIKPENKNVIHNSLYRDFLEATHPFLDNEGPGCIIINEVTDPRIVNHKRIFLPKYVNTQLFAFIKAHESEFQIILPAACALWWKDCYNPRNCFSLRMLYVKHSRLPSNRNYDSTNINYKVLLFKGVKIEKDETTPCMRLPRTADYGDMSDLEQSEFQRTCCKKGHIWKGKKCSDKNCPDCFSTIIYRGTQ